jgi:type I restriction enzyme S subunit
MAVNELVGPVPDGWENTTLGLACQRSGGDIQTGPFGSQLHAADYVPVGIPSIMPQNIGDNRIVEDGIARITPEDAKRLGRYLVRKGDIVYSRRGDVERRALIREHEDGWLCGTGCLRVRLGDQGPDPRFATYYLGHPAVREWIVRHAHGATMPNLNTSILGACPFVVPPLDEQRTIAHILGTLDERIELNRCMSETLEAIARALFKSWFVDFDPVRARAEGRPTGLPPHLDALFPDSFKESELGEIPIGWSATRWGSICKLEYGKGLTDYGDELGRYPVYGTNGPIGSHVTPLCQHEGIVIGRKGAYRGVHYSSSPFFVIDTAFYVEPVVPVEMRWAYYELLRVDINSMDSGSAIPSTSREDFYALPVVYPSIDVQAAYVSLLSSAWNRQNVSNQQSRGLANVRDALLPKLISGGLRVRVSDRTVAAFA